MAGSRTRVLVEHENPRVRDAQAAALEAAGMEVTTCAGPASLPGGTCPLVVDGHCDLASGADVIVNGLPLGHLRVYMAQRTRLTSRAVLLGLSESQRVRHPVLARLATTVARNTTGAELVEAVREAAHSDAIDRHAVGPSGSAASAKLTKEARDEDEDVPQEA